MSQQRVLIVLWLAVALPACAQDTPSPRSAWSAWQSAPSLGIRQPRLQLGVELDALHAPGGMRWVAAPTPALDLRLVGKAALAPNLAAYGSVGAVQASMGPTATMGAAGSATNVGLSYGAGLRWDFGEHASATIGVDGYELRSLTQREPVLTTRLGLKVRY